MVEIVFTYFKSNDFRLESLGFNVAVFDTRFTPSPNQRFLYIKKKSEMASFLGNNPGEGTVWDNTLHYLSGNVNIMIYNSINDVNIDDPINVYLHNVGDEPNFHTNLSNLALLFSMIDVPVISPVYNLFFCDKNLYPTSVQNNICLVYGTVYNEFHKNIYLAADLILLFSIYISQNKIFCGLTGKIPNVPKSINKTTANLLISNNVNFAIGKSIINPKNLSGKLTHHVYTNKWIRKVIRKIMLSYVGRENGEDLWSDVRNELESFGAFLNSLPCGPTKFTVKIDNDNNVENSTTLNAEIHYYGSTTDGFADIQDIKITINLI